jgi:hypothetical protein
MFAECPPTMVNAFMEEKWDVWQGDYNRYARLNERELLIGSSWRGDGHTDNAGTCSVAEFLAGTFQREFCEYFGQQELERALYLAKRCLDKPIR